MDMNDSSLSKKKHYKLYVVSQHVSLIGKQFDAQFCIYFGFSEINTGSKFDRKVKHIIANRRERNADTLSNNPSVYQPS